MKDHTFFMRRVLELASFGQGKVEPNPMVGAVLVRNYKIIAEAFHRRFGGEHAEVIALRKAGPKAKGAILYVNLEPCTHYGKTPPCTERIIKAGVKVVVAACKDPNPLVNGRGLQTLKKRGIKVILGVLKEQAKSLNLAFFKFHHTGLPYVISKWAMSLDGKIATSSGESRWISSEASRRYVRRLRDTVQAVVIGINTAIKDDPQLKGLRRSPVRVVLDSRCMLPIGSRLVKSARLHRTMVVVSKDAPASRIRALHAKGCQIIILKRLRLEEVLRSLAKHGFLRVLIEGGGKVHASAFKEGLVDEVFVFVAPKIIGGRDAPTPVEGEGISQIQHALRLRGYRWDMVGQDLLLHAKLGRWAR